jgi:MFS family permease
MGGARPPRVGTGRTPPRHQDHGPGVQPERANRGGQIVSTTTAAEAGAGAPASGTSYGSPRYRLYVLMVLTLVYTVNFIDRNLLNVIGPQIIEHFQLSDSDFGLLNGPPFAIFYALAGIPLAMAADRKNRIIIIALCLSVWSIMAALCGFATSFAFLLIARIGVAIGEAGGTPPSSSVIGDYFKPKSRANALAIFAMGVTIGGALSNYFGGPIAQHLNGPALEALFQGWGWDWAVNMTDWSQVQGWRVAFVVIGAPGVLLALLLLFTVREPPRGYSDPPGTVHVEKAGMMETFKELLKKPTFWTISLGAAMAALVGYGLTAFQSPMFGRLHAMNSPTFAWEFGGPLAIFAALGTFAGGFIVDKWAPKQPRALAWVPAIGFLVCIPLAITAWYQPTENIMTVTRPVWLTAVFFHYMYIGSQYSITQGLVGQRSRAAAIAILLLIIALLGNAPGPYITGWLSDMFMQNLLTANPDAGGVAATDCRLVLTGRAGFTAGFEEAAARVSEAQRAVCAASYGEGLRQSMVATLLLFIPTAILFFLGSLTLKKDMVARTH